MAYNPADGMIYWAYRGSFQTWQYGDLNDDYDVNAYDAQILLDSLTKKDTSKSIDNADVNEDGKKTTLDAHIMLQNSETYGQEFCLVRIDPSDANAVTVSRFEYVYGQPVGVVITDNSEPVVSEKPTEVLVEPAELTIIKHNTAVLSATVYPWNLENRSVIWESSDETIAKVDANGVVTALIPGNVTITARSVLDNSISGSCDITVELPDVTLSGVVNDAQSKTGLFTWDMSKDAGWTMGHELEFGVESAALDTESNTIYICDSAANRWDLHKVDANTGTAIDETLTNYLAIPLWDMTISQGFKAEDEKPMICAVYGYDFIMPLDPANLPKKDENFLIATFPEMLAGVASAGKTIYKESIQIGPRPWETQTVEHEAEIFYLLDATGTIWKITMRYDENAQNIFDIANSETKSWSTSITDLGVDFSGFGGNRMLCSLVLADDGRLYLSAFNHGVTQLYRFTYDESKDTWAVDYLGDMGEEVYPAALYMAQSGAAQGTALAFAEAGGEHREAVRVMSVTADSLLEQSANVAKTYAPFAPTTISSTRSASGKTPEVQLTGGGSNGEAYINVVVSNCQNTRVTVEFGSELEYTGFEKLTLVNGETAVASVNDTEAHDSSSVEIAFASADLVTGSVVRLKFKVKEDAVAQGLKSVSGKMTLIETGNSIYEEGESAPKVEVRIPIEQKNLTITGAAPGEGLVYSGKPQSGYTGTPAAEGYDGEFTLTYYDATGAQIDGAPVDAGNYTLVITPEDTDAYTGELALEFSIEKKQLTWSPVRVEKYEGNNSEAYATVQPVLEGVVAGDTVTVVLTDVVTEGFAQYVTVGSYEGITINPVDGNGWNFRPSNPKNYILPEGAPVAYGVVRPIYYAQSVELSKLQNGEIRASKSYAVIGETVTLTPAPDAGYAVDAVTVTDVSGNKVKVTDNGDGTYTFVMPGTGVTVDVTFRFACDGVTECPSEPYVDVDQSAWYHEYVDYVIRHNLMVGIGKNVFSPDGTVTRGQLVTVLWTLDGAPTGEENVFTDVAEGTWYREPIAWAAAHDIVSGYGGGLFGPDDPVTRQQMVTILYSYARYKGYDLTAAAELTDYTDADSVDVWALPAMRWAVGNAIVTGTSAVTLTPNGISARDQVAVVLMNFREKFVK